VLALKHTRDEVRGLEDYLIDGGGMAAPLMEFSGISGVGSKCLRFLI
jgi:hypothetical protein